MKPVHGPSGNRSHRTRNRHAGDEPVAPSGPVLNYAEPLTSHTSAAETDAGEAEAAVRRPRSRRHHFRRGAGAPAKPAGPRAAPRRSRRSRYVDEGAHGEAEGVAPVRRPRGAARRRKPLWVLLKRVSYGLAVVAVLECGLALLTSPKFAVHGVEFPANDFIPASTAAAVQDSLIGQNWVRLRAAQAERTLKSVPQVRSAHVTRLWSWPPQVAVQVEARQPFARVGGGDEWYVVDREGVPFRPATAEDSGLYAVTGPLFNPVPGQPIDSRHWEPVVEFASTLARDEEKGQRWSLRRVYFDRKGFASLRLTGGANDETLVQLGDGDWPRKLEKARWALADFAQTGKHAATLNLISSEVTTWTPRVPPSTEGEAAVSGDVNSTGAPTEEAPATEARDG